MTRIFVLVTLLTYSTLKQGCIAGIKLWLSEDHKFLTVTDVVEDHNHEVDKVSACMPVQKC